MVMVHAENADCIAWLTERLAADGLVAPRFHALSRPGPVEREATHRAITFSELVDVPILLVHVSGGEALEQIRWAQGRGLNIHAETCPQYLLLTAESLGGPGFEGAKCVCSPPPRDRASQQQVWDGLARGVFAVVSSDHAPFNYDDPHGKRLGGREPPFSHIPNGIPGLETRMPLLLSEGVGTGRIDIHQFVALTATNAAKLYGLYPRKGTLAIGSDADIVIWDTEREVTIRNARLHHAVDYTPYEGLAVRGWPATTLLRGEEVWADGQFRGRPGRGEFRRCAAPSAARARRRGSPLKRPTQGEAP
jgi:dihydropyrimidinase